MQENVLYNVDECLYFYEVWTNENTMDENKIESTPHQSFANASKVKDLAIHYRSMGLCVVPVKHGTKMPSIDWKQYQTEKPMLGELLLWFSSNSTGIGLICGKVSRGIVCLDFDAPGSYEAFRASNPQIASFPTAQSHRGKHVFFISPEEVKSGALYFEGFEGKAGDIIAERKFVVLPPTQHPEGTERSWIVSLDSNIPVAHLRDFNIISAPPSSGGFTEGGRHDSLLRHAVELAKQGVCSTELPTLVREANADLCKPPLPSAEVDGIIQFALERCIITRTPSKSENDDEKRDQSFIIIPPFLREENDDEKRFNHLFTPATLYMEKERDDEPIDWLVRDMLPLSYLVILGATSKAGKSCLASCLAHAVCTGTEFLGNPTRQGAVLWLAYEESEAERRLILREYQPVAESLYITHEKVLVDTISGVAGLRYWIQKTNAVLLVIDPLYGAVGSESLSDGRKARMALEGLKDLCRTENVTAVVLHHLTKRTDAGLTRERFADSNQILATASMDWIMESKVLDDGAREIHLHGTGRGEFANQTWVIHSTSPHTFSLVANGSRDQVAPRSLDSQVLAVLSSATQGLPADMIAEQIDANLRSVQNCLTYLMKENRICTVGKRGKASLYAADRVLVEVGE
ncbi:MAG TPA: AAA family ATPase [Fimbriimonas sp.]|nr:AAA family ATPase [Fimbriimonas sp.]